MASEMKPLTLGDVTPWGKVAAVMVTSGERYYFLVDRLDVVSMMPATTVENGPWLRFRDSGSAE